MDSVGKMSEDTTQYLKSNSEEDATDAAKEAAAYGLKDPDSAKFRNVRLVDFNGGQIVCGEINGKNSYGAYVGYVPFVASPKEATLMESEQGQRAVAGAAANAGIFDACLR